MSKGKRSNNKRLSKEEIEELEVIEIDKSMQDLSAKVQNEQIQFKPGTDFKTESQKKLYRKIKENQMIFIHGPAGSGKTFTALRAALEIMKNDNNINEILITKPIIEAGEEHIGFLKGDLLEKTQPYMKSFYSTMEKLIGKATTNMLKTREYVKEEPIAYMRGSTFDNCICIIDEAQNTTVTGLKLIISRLGQNAKMIIMGDTDQVDIKIKETDKTGLQDAFERFKGIKGISFHEFSEDDIVRNSLLIDIMKRYKK